LFREKAVDIQRTVAGADVELMLFIFGGKGDGRYSKDSGWN
jgi:hypothetical protein